MCFTKTTRHTICGHRSSIRGRCQNYHSKPRQKCEKYQYNDIVLDLCPKCSPPSHQPVPPSIHPEPETRQVAETSHDATPGEIKGVAARASLTMGKKKIFRGLKNLLGRPRGSNESEKRSEVTVAKTSMETLETMKSSERFAEEYMGIIGHHPSVGESRPERGRLGVRPVTPDIETCTTWSGILPRQPPLSPPMIEQPKTAEEEPISSRPLHSREDELSNGGAGDDLALEWIDAETSSTWSGVMERQAPEHFQEPNIAKESLPWTRPDYLDPETLQDSRMAEEEYPARKSSKHWNPDKMKDLRRAEKKLAMVRDGRGAMHFNC